MKVDVNSALWCFSNFDCSNIKSLFCLTVADKMLRLCDYPLKYVYTSYVINLKMANKTNDTD